jgi:hypothetical protein
LDDLCFGVKDIGGSTVARTKMDMDFLGGAFMRVFFRFGLVMSITALTMLAGCGSAEKSSPPPPSRETPPASGKTPPAPSGSHTMPDGTKMNEQDMKK